MHQLLGDLNFAQNEKKEKEALFNSDWKHPWVDKARPDTHMYGDFSNFTES